ncbi:MAG TPA: SAM-dependent chlorinase/fluorinase [Acidimicrobiales bacterium]|nr:SAM-dependent chlorinase/fluorinase [Acidimicrobiales bacterium]
MVPPRARTGAVFLLTDYGTDDEFVGILHAVVLRLAPGAPVVDLTHAIPAHDVRAGARALGRAAPYLGPGVVVGVVDPGVGGARRNLALQVTGYGGGPSSLVGPDNGLLVEAAEILGGVDVAVVLPPGGGDDDRPRTFDGRDVFAPAAAALWRGATAAELGVPVDPASLVRLPDPFSEMAKGELQAEVLWIDRFGNAQLAVDASVAGSAGLIPGAALAVTAGGRRHAARRVRSFAELAHDEVGVLADANGRLAVVCNKRSAATVLGLEVGDVVTVGWT